MKIEPKSRTGAASRPVEITHTDMFQYLFYNEE